jgi:hypothetical protein
MIDPRLSSGPGPMSSAPAHYTLPTSSCACCSNHLNYLNLEDRPNSQFGQAGTKFKRLIYSLHSMFIMSVPLPKFLNDKTQTIKFPTKNHILSGIRARGICYGATEPGLRHQQSDSQNRIRIWP